MTKFPMKIKLNAKPTTEFYDTIENIHVEMVNPPPLNYKELCYKMVMSSWQDNPNMNIPNEEELRKVFLEILNFKMLPNSLEGLTFIVRIDGLTMVEITHLLRHRLFFSIHAQCTSDRFLHNDSAFIPSSIKNSKFSEKYKKLTEDAKELYAEMIKSDEIHMLDARYILPRNLRHFYYVGMNLRSAIDFINQRKCTAIQPELDNILAIKLYMCIAKYIPEIIDVISLSCNNNCIAVKSKPEYAFRLFQPDEDHIKSLETLSKDDFIYKKTRKEMGSVL